MSDNLLDYMNLRGVGRGVKTNPVGLAVDQYGLLNPPMLGQGSDQPERFNITAQEVLDYMALPSDKKLSYAKYREGFDKGEIPFNLFDYSQQGPVFDDIEDVDRYEAPKGASQRLKRALSTRGLRSKFIKYAEIGTELMPDTWYGTNPLYKKYEELLGPERAREKYIRDIWIVAGTSPQSKVPNNIKTASYYQFLAEQGIPLPEDTVKPSEATEESPQFPPPGYGHVVQKNHLRNVKSVLETGGLDPFHHPKPATFATNLLGNESQVTIDAHNFRLLGMLSKDPAFLKTQYEYTDKNKKKVKINPKKLVTEGKMTMRQALKNPNYWVDVPEDNEYKYYEEFQQKLAKKLGMTPAQLQEKLWVGAGDLTGLESPPEPFSKTVETRIKYTAEALGKDPQEVLERYILGEIPLAKADTEMTGLLG